MTTQAAVEQRPDVVIAPASKPRRRRRGLISLAAAIAVSGAVLYAAFFPAGPLPALGPAFNPVTGAWTMAADAQVTDRTVGLPGLQQPVRVLFEANGTAHLSAQTDHDLFLATGYVHARFRLFQMDLMRRQGAGRLSEIVGRAALDTDRFELQLGLLRTAQAEWTQLPADDLSRQALIAYAQGVNDRIAEAEKSHQLDAMFTLLGYRPQPWTPIDSLLIKGDMTQTLSFDTTPITTALIDRSLGHDLTSVWFPVLPPNQQSPFDPGPYTSEAPTGVESMRSVTDAESQAAAAIHDVFAALPPSLLKTFGASNNWAVAPSKSSTGGALLAGDPHLHLTLPAIWFQLTMDSPNYHVAGVSIPGTPGVAIGHNQHIAWSLTDAMNQQTLYYEEKEDPSHPNQYLWKGAWKTYQTIAYDIPVAGSPTEHLIVKLSVHGPVITDRGITTSVWWGGDMPSPLLSVLLRIGQAGNWTQFRNALRDWRSPSHNFVYADDQGNIGLISAGLYPQVAKGQPGLPLPGTGEYDVTGSIPFDDIPQVYDPPSGIVWSANQWQVTPSYPYYLGTAHFYDPGYRANEIHRVLSQPGKLSASDMQALQTDTRDFLAAEIVPVLLGSLNGQALDPKETKAAALLRGWDYRMDVDSAAATIWNRFWTEYLDETFTPWWKSRSVPVAMSEVTDTLGQDLETWTLHDPTNSAFSAPGVGSRDAPAAQRTAFAKAVAGLSGQLGSNPATWAWGRVHQRVLDNLAQVKGLDFGPVSERGDANTPLAAGGFPSDHGPSWRMVVDWGTQTFLGVYPGGQSENPASGWYTNRATAWFAGGLDPMLGADAVASMSGSGVTTWRLHP